MQIPKSDLGICYKSAVPVTNRFGPAYALSSTGR